MELDMVTDMEVDKVDDIGVNMVADIDVDINMEFQIGEIVGHGGWLIGSKLFRPKAFPACASSKLYEFIRSKIISSTYPGQSFRKFVSSYVCS